MLRRDSLMYFGFLFLSACLCMAASGVRAEVKPLVVEGAPFPLTVSEWTPPARDFPITAYGAKEDGKPVTEAIEAAIDAAAKSGGGRVVLPPGEWLSGAFRLKGNVALVVEKGATLHFPDDPVIVMRAPLQPSGRPTMTHQALIGANSCTNVAVMGDGTILSDVAYWHDNFMINPQRGFPRPQVMHFERCKNVRVEGVKVRGSPAWTMHFRVCEDIVMRGVDSVCTGPNTDGLDLESCNRALIENCSLDQTDDTYTIKSGFNESGRKRNIPTQNVVIRNCRAVHGHTLLAIGSEVSGGIRNIYMTDCTVEAECWRFLYVKTNSKRGAFVENVWMENVKGVSASQAVFETEMYYDGNPVKELTKKAEKTWPTAISNIFVRNVVCGEAGYAVKVRGDAELPPRRLFAENIRVGRLRHKPVGATNAPELDVKDVREDPSALREVLGLPPQVRQYEAAQDGRRDAPSFDLADLEGMSANAMCRTVLGARIAEEVKTGRNVAPCVTPQAALEKSYSAMYSRRVVQMLADLGCALPGAWIADDVREVSRKSTDASLSVVPDLKSGTVRVSFTNRGKAPIENVWCVAHLAPQWMTRRQTFRIGRVAPGETVARVLSCGAGSHYLPRPVGASPYAASVDFTLGGTRRRLWATAETPDAKVAPNLVDAVRHAGPMDALDADEATLLDASAGTGALPALGGHRWECVAFPGAAWYNASPRRRQYTENEQGLIRANRAYEVAAVQFDVPSNAVTILRCTAPNWTRRAVAFLNGERLPLKSLTANIPARPGRNRLIVKYPSQSGEETALLQMSVYPWDSSTCWTCVAFPAKTQKRAKSAVGGRSSPEFALEWNSRWDVTLPYEVEVSTNKLVSRAGVTPGSGFAVSALSRKGRTPLKVTALPGRTDGCVFLRFKVPQGTTGLVCRADSKAPLAVADPDRTDNLFAGALASTAKWSATPRMKIDKADGGALTFAARSPGEPEATYDIAVPPGLTGRSVRFETELENEAPASCRLMLRVQQLDAEGKTLPESVVDSRWTGLMFPSSGDFRFVERGRIHTEAKTVRLFLKIGASSKPYDLYGMPNADANGKMPCLRMKSLVLRAAEFLPFPKYDESNFAAGVSGEAGDLAIRLGGSDEKAFWYQTRSQASWAESVQLRDERRIFFPAGAGTVESWLKSDWKPTTYTDKGETKCRPIILFQCYQSYRAHMCIGGKGAMLELSYRPQPGKVDVVLRDRFNTVYKGSAAVKLPEGRWCHLAMQWAPGDVAEVFVDGRSALKLPVPKLKALDLADREIKYPNDEGGLEFYLGSNWLSARKLERIDPTRPFFEGAADLLRVSTGKRYGGDFKPAKSFGVDVDTRALFSFDDSFDGVSGGGIGWIPGTTRSLGAGREARDLRIGGKTVPYWPKGILPENDPAVALNGDNYPNLPTAADFEAARRPFRKVVLLKPGEAFEFDCPEKVTTDFVEISNESGTPLEYPIVLNAGDVDPRSYGDLADTLRLDALPERERADRLFGFVLSSMDYFMNHTAMFQPGSDKPRDVEYNAMYMFNGYCGFECGPLNNLAANLFVAVAKCPAVQTGGYGHSFQQVFYGGKNHIYDVSFRKFFPAMDNETAAGLDEADNECGIFPRLGIEPECFTRKSTRGHWVQTPDCVAKIGVTLNPGESFRVWQVNDGNCNDLVVRSKTGPYRGYESQYRPDATALCHADTEKVFLQRTERAFPQYLSGFIRYNGAPGAGNPAFTDAGADSFCYRVNGGGYPIVEAGYSAVRRDGTKAEIEISTDNGKTFRPLATPAGYAVRARYAYLVRVMAPIDDVAEFSASTEVQLNPRIFPGRLMAGGNRLTLKATSGVGARVTVQGRAPAGRISIPAAVSSGAVLGAETLFYAFDPAKRPTLDVIGASPSATVRTTGGLRATLSGGKLTLSADVSKGDARFCSATIVDGGAEKTLAVLVGTGVRFAAARDAEMTGGARRMEPDAMSPQVRGRLARANHGAEIAFKFDPLPAGKYAVLNLNRFMNADGPVPEMGLHDTQCIRMIWPGLKSTDAGSSHNLGCNYKRTRFGRPGGPANFKWDYPWHPGTSYPYPVIRVAEYPAADGIQFRSWSNTETAEIAAVLIVPDPSRDLRFELTKVLCGLNCDPWRIAEE